MACAVGCTSPINAGRWVRADRGANYRVPATQRTKAARARGALRGLRSSSGSGALFGRGFQRWVLRRPRALRIPQNGAFAVFLRQASELLRQGKRFDDHARAKRLST
eukprot:7144938-Prymnesium_polylepis.1